MALKESRWPPQPLAVAHIKTHTCIPVTYCFIFPFKYLCILAKESMLFRARIRRKLPETLSSACTASLRP